MNETRISPFVKWTILAVASVGFLFDIYEILVGPLVLQPALGELAGLKPGTQEYRDWAAWIFWIPPVTGGLFGLLGGYLADLFGRRRVLVWSILLYTAAALSAGMSTSLPMLLVFRALTFVGVCVEFVAAVAWLAVVWLPSPFLSLATPAEAGDEERGEDQGGRAQLRRRGVADASHPNADGRGVPEDGGELEVRTEEQVDRVERDALTRTGMATPAAAPTSHGLNNPMKSVASSGGD